MAGVSEPIAIGAESMSTATARPASTAKARRRQALMMNIFVFLAPGQDVRCPGTATAARGVGFPNRLSRKLTP